MRICLNNKNVSLFFTMNLTKFIRCDESTHKELKLYTIKENKRNMNESIRDLLQGVSNE